MAKSQFKAGGPTRGRRRVRKIGMGSGKYLLERKEARKGVWVPPSDDPTCDDEKKDGDDKKN